MFGEFPSARRRTRSGKRPQHVVRHSKLSLAVYLRKMRERFVVTEKFERKSHDCLEISKLKIYLRPRWWELWAVTETMPPEQQRQVALVHCCDYDYIVMASRSIQQRKMWLSSSLVVFQFLWRERLHQLSTEYGFRMVICRVCVRCVRHVRGKKNHAMKCTRSCIETSDEADGGRTEKRWKFSLFFSPNEMP